MESELGIRRPVGSLPPSKPLAGPAPPRRSVCAPGTMPLHPYADRRREAMFMPKTKRQVARSAERRLLRKAVVVGAFVACALGALATKTARATPPEGFTATNLAGPVMLGDIHTVLQTPGYGVMINTRGPS